MAGSVPPLLNETKKSVTTEIQKGALNPPPPPRFIAFKIAQRGDFL